MYSPLGRSQLDLVKGHPAPPSKLEIKVHDRASPIFRVTLVERADGASVGVPHDPHLFAEKAQERVDVIRDVLGRAENALPAGDAVVKGDNGEKVDGAVL